MMKPLYKQIAELKKTNADSPFAQKFLDVAPDLVRYCKELRQRVVLQPKRYHQEAGFSVRALDGQSTVRYSGLTRILSVVFFKSEAHQRSSNQKLSSSEKKARKKSRSEKKKQHEQLQNEFEASAAEMNDSIDGIRCSTSGERHGTRVHNQVGAMCKAFWETGCYYDDRNIEQYDQCALKAIKTFEECAWVPVAVEQPVFNEELRIASAIDFIMYDLNQMEFVLVELKSSNHKNDAVFTRGHSASPCGPMNQPLHQLTSTDYNRAWVQLLFSMGMLHGYLPPAFRPHRGVLLFVSSQESECMMYEAPKWANSLASIFKNYMRLVDSISIYQQNERKLQFEEMMTTDEMDTQCSNHEPHPQSTPPTTCKKKRRRSKSPQSRRWRKRRRRQQDSIL